MTAPALQPEYPHSLLERISDARNRSDAIFSLLSSDALDDRPIPERHRLIFYLGHLEAFDWNLLGSALDLKSENSAFDKLFAFGIDPTNGNLPHDVPRDWPSEEQVRAYNVRIRERIDANLSRALGARAIPPEVRSGLLLHVAIEHRLMHVETLAYLLHQLPFNKKRSDRVSLMMKDAPVQPHMVAIPEGRATLGQAKPNGNGDSSRGHFSEPRQPFGWDNEFEETSVEVPAFSIDAYPVTNGQFLEFVRAGGYSDLSLWRPKDCEWKLSAGVTHPSFWIPRSDGWKFRGMFEEFPLPLGAPVWVSHAEASAYARWAGKALPTEAQWHRAAYGTPYATERAYPWGEAPPSSARGNFNFTSWDPTPVSWHPMGGSAFGVFDLLGNGWEWTSTRFAPLPGFEPFPFYRGYSTDFFDGNHYVMKGGSQRTAACILRRSFRNWFQPHYPYAYAKFRSVEA